MTFCDRDIGNFGILLFCGEFRDRDGLGNTVTFSCNERRRRVVDTHLFNLEKKE